MNVNTLSDGQIASLRRFYSLMSKCLPDEKRQDLAVFAVFVKNYLKKENER